MADYKPEKIEKKWQRFWERQEIYKAKDYSKKPKLYLLVEFPYPSGEGLHVGHCRSYTALDVVARKRRMEGYNVLFPMGWDAFGLPTENYAVKSGIHPRAATKKNTTFFKRQQKSLGLSFDWSREINTTNPPYYKWTQWIFLQLFKKGLAYKARMPINWCPVCKIGLANEEVIDGTCERCGSPVTRKEKEQWLLKITKYAERLIQDLSQVDFPERVKILQKEWVGKSEGTEIKFSILPKGKPATSYKISELHFSITVFTTRTDTIFGCTYLVLAPENPIIEKLKGQIKNLKSIENYVARAKRKLERERISTVREKTGVRLEGIKAVNPATNKEIPIFVADYVLMHYGTGAIMAVPAHDQRDLEFARCYNLPIQEVIVPQSYAQPRESTYSSGTSYERAYEGEGVLKNSGRFDGLKSEVARGRIEEWLSRRGLVKKAVHYKLRDWIFSRQRYWGEPIPLIFCDSCKKLVENSNLQFPISKQIENSNIQNPKPKFNAGELLNPGWFAVSEDDLPVKLPQVKDYKPTEKGESPLASVERWLNTKCPRCQGPAKRETDVMPNWAGSNWYFLRYCDPKNDEKLAGPKSLRYWMPVDWYNGGMEHTTLHLLYSRFVYKFLWDIGGVPKSLMSEPYKRRTSHGMVLGEGGIKMSKSKGNIINPDEVIKEYGADTLRMYEMFMGPFSQAIAWDTKGVKGVKRFLDKVWRLANEDVKCQMSNVKSNPKSKCRIINLKKVLHRTIKKVSEDIENLKFNTAVSSLMEFSNAWQADKAGLGKKDFKDFLKLLSPFAPHFTEELWQKVKPRSRETSLPQKESKASYGARRGRQKNLKEYRKQDSIFAQKWPKYNQKLIEEEKLTLLIQINGKVKDKTKVARGFSEKKTKELALARTKIKKLISGKEIKKTIFVRDKLINFVIDFVGESKPKA